MIHLAVDLGSKRIGLAISDAEERFAFPLGVVAAGSVAANVEAIRQRARAEQAEVVLVGLPLNMDDSVGPMARRSEAFAAALRAAGLRVELVDERLTSYTAEQMLAEVRRAGGGGRGAGRQGVDAQAAAVLLQGYLDRRRSAGGPG